MGGFGARTPGSEGDVLARAYLAAAFEAAGAEVRIVREGSRRHLIADQAGDSEDVLLLVAAYPSLDPDLWIGDSGAALLLELARVLPRERPQYTIRFALADTREVAEEVGDEGESDSRVALNDPAEGRKDDPSAARRRVVRAGESLARALDASGDSSRVRGIFVFEGGGRAKFRAARDLRSHPLFRDDFWTSARALGFESLFPLDAGWASPRSLHLGFVTPERKMDGVVAIVDEDRARPEIEQSRISSVGSAASLEALGRVTVDALGRIMHRLSRIDDFASPKIPSDALSDDRGDASAELEAATPSEGSGEPSEITPSS